MNDLRSAVPAIALAIAVFVVLAILKLANEAADADGGTSQRFSLSQIQVYPNSVSQHVPAGRLIRPGEPE